MAMTVTARNTATKATQGSSTSLACAFTVTSTVAGDVGVVVITADVTATSGGSPTATWSVPSGWVTAAGPSRVVNGGTGLAGTVIAIFINPSLAAGVTSVSFTATISGGTGTRTVTNVQGCYAAFPGGQSSLTTSGPAAAGATSSSATIPSVSTGAAATGPDLIVWGGSFADLAAVSVGTPTNFTSVVNLAGSANNIPVRMAVAIGTNGLTTTASGATATTGNAAYVGIIVGLTNRAGDGFFALASR